jgi:hypothetical protein
MRSRAVLRSCGTGYALFFQRQGDSYETHNRLFVAYAGFHRRGIWPDFTTEVVEGRMLPNLLRRWLRRWLLPGWLPGRLRQLLPGQITAGRV